MGNSVKLTWHTEKRKLGELIEWDKNPRQLKDHDAEHLKKSLDNFGVADPLIINTDNRIIGGHMRRRIMLQSGYKPDDLVDVRVPERELTEREAEELAIRLNKNTGDWDFDALANNFELDDLLEWGFEKQELDLDLWAGEPPEDVEPQIDKAEELREKWGVESGQLWKLGEHRIICGDCTDKTVVEKLVGEDKCFVLTDPPYGVNIINNNKDKGNIGGGGKLSGKFIQAGNYSPVVGDDSTDIAKIFYELCLQLGFEDMIIWGGNYFTDFLPPRSCWIVWDKRENDAHNNFADCELAWTTFKSPARIYRQMWNGAFRAGKKDIEGKKRVHPTQKPVRIHEEILQDFSDDTDIIFDGFLGSGTTLIACERLGRKCRAVEISPAYVAVAIQRWVDLTGGTPELVEPVIQV